MTCSNCGTEIRLIPKCGDLQCRLRQCEPLRWFHWDGTARDHSARP